MENENSPSTLAGFVSKNSQLIKTAEKISLLVLAIGLIIYFLKIENLNFILIIGSILTAIVYFLYAFSIVDVEGIESTGILNSIGFINLIYKLTYFGLSITALSIMSLAITGPFETLLNVGAINLLLVVVISIFTKVNDRSKIYNIIYYLRVVTASLFMFYLLNHIKHWF
jgi:hypothetical protein